ncbi:UBA/THIF-type NAD/FAD binding protein [Thermodesulfatator indicus DSM 15286]|uniref:UBA/THIF-type NAD/FAD binding protein n=1 Tax=Thermodesulfatator indicus (strain DSM 15286 / JCM 11887 / CIR29812) TaxID=667014 RepID=F8A9N0_THEID|nr:ThiF family adenylyltransferase [Thermodesulfatator indicus]AEH45261.1 UBA/THIF-type NAD/FAD binding protein [Thermodesulfatator indicus DSM 15286]
MWHLIQKSLLGRKLEKYNIRSEASFFEEVFKPQRGLFSEEDQKKLRQATVAIAGLGGVGGTHLVSLIRTGVGRFKLAEFDVFEPRNISRQYGARVDTLGRPKGEVMLEEAFRLNPFLQIEYYKEGITPENIDAFLDGVDVVLDGVEFFAVEARKLLYDTARAKKIPLITAGPLGFSASLLIFDPEKSPSFDEYFAIKPDMSPVEKAILFALGLAPKPIFLRYIDFKSLNLKAGQGPASVIACYLCSALAAMEAVRIILGRPGLKPVPHYLQIDLYLRKLYEGYLKKGNRSATQRLKFFFLKKKLGL